MVKRVFTKVNSSYIALETVHILFQLKILNTVFGLDSMNQIMINVFNVDAEYIFVIGIIAIYK
jgi:hypothetical protein